MDVSKIFYDGKRNAFFEVKEGRKISCVKIFCYTSSTVKTSENVLKIGCLQEILQQRAQNFIFEIKRSVRCRV